jgi:hypothetical protein
MILHPSNPRTNRISKILPDVVAGAQLRLGEEVTAQSRLIFGEIFDLTYSIQLGGPIASKFRGRFYKIAKLQTQADKIPRQ